MRTLVACSCMLLMAFTARPAQARPKLLDPEMTSREYARFTSDLLALEDGSSENENLRMLLAIGKRNLQWIDHLNSLRPADDQLKLSAPELQPGNDIDHVRRNNPTLLMQHYQTWTTTAPQSVQDVLTSTVAYPDATGMADDAFLAVAREIDGIYDLTSRWLLEAPYLEEYKTYKKYDVRGYVFLQREVDLPSKLEQWAALSDEDKAHLTPLLVGQCFNAEATTEAECQAEFTSAVQNGTVLAYFQAHFGEAKAMYDGYFAIPRGRHDVIWTGAEPLVLKVPFRDPHNERVFSWLRDNIQDEFQWNGWKLRLDFQESNSDGMTHVVFEDGATPHVDDIAGSTITMDANRDLDEYSERWTIRHEYGHVLGLPDCYVEFYDAAEQAMISYQLDLSNLMCSRRGHFQQQHFDELHRVYFTAQ